MSRLNDLYKAIETLRKEGVSTNDLEEKVGQAEEEIIKNEILPIVTKNIAPALSQVQRELVLVVDYIPGTNISVHLSRKRNFTDQMDTIEILPDPQVEHNIGNIKRRGDRKAPRTNLRVTFPNGKMIENRFALDTLKEIVINVGIEKVRALQIVQCGVPLISNTLDKVYSSSQKELSNGWYLMTLSSTITKKQQIDKISRAYHLGLEVTII